MKSIIAYDLHWPKYFWLLTNNLVTTQSILGSIDHNYYPINNYPINDKPAVNRITTSLEKALLLLIRLNLHFNLVWNVH